MEQTTELKEKLKSQIILFLNLTDLTPADIKDDEPLFGEYGINIQDPKVGRKVLVDINTMAAYIEEHRSK